MSRRSIELTTERLALRPLTVEDAPLLHELWSSEGVRRFLWDDEVMPIARTTDVIEQSCRLFGEQHFGLWAAWSNDGVQLVGFGGLWPFREPATVELLYGVAEHLWGNGYATEIAAAVIRYCFDSLDLPVVRASSDVANAASIRLLEKLGFGFVGRRTESGLDTVFYGLPRPAV